MLLIDNYFDGFYMIFFYFFFSEMVYSCYLYDMFLFGLKDLKNSHIQQYLHSYNNLEK